MTHKFKIVLLGLAVVFAVGCASSVPPGQFSPTKSLAVVGVTIAPGVESGKNQIAMALELEELIHAGGQYKTLRTTDLARAMDSYTPGSYKVMLDNFAGSGALHQQDLIALSSAQLPVQSALILRIEKNEVSPGAPKSVQLRNNVGDILTDRERVVLSTVREMQMRASMINVATGNVFWSRTYRSTPASETSYTHYSGSSFSGSLAASLANTMTNGLRVPEGPLPPSNQLTLRSLMREVVRNLP